MQTQRDHVHAHQFMMGRLSSALVQGDPSSAELPGRRALTGLLCGLLAVVLVLAGFTVYGWIVPGGSTAVREKGLILVEKETGTRYVYLGGMLHPTPNLTSALLLQGPGSQVKLVSRNSLKDVPRGPALGIAGAPQSIPPADALVAGPWLVCLPPGEGGPEVGIDLDPRTPSAPLPPDRFVVVRDQDGRAHLLTPSRQFPVADEAVLVALAAAGRPGPVAARRWLAQLPAGPELKAPQIAGAGDPGLRVSGRPHPVGTLFRQRADTGEEQLYVLRGDGLAPVSRTDFQFLAARSATAPLVVSAADVVAAPKSADRTLVDRIPDLMALRPADTAGGGLCLRQRPASEQAMENTVVLAPATSPAVERAAGGLVAARPGTGMTVVAVPQQGRTPEMFFISDEGISYAIRDTQAASSLNLAGARTVPFPRNLLAGMPQGPSLSREAVTGLAGR